jgi:hypothetical protein
MSPTPKDEKTGAGLINKAREQFEALKDDLKEPERLNSGNPFSG